MTREEALKEIPHQTGTVEGTEELINEIYDDFGTCKECKHFYTEEDRNKCTNLVYFGNDSTNMESLNEDFYCADFKRITYDK